MPGSTLPWRQLFYIPQLIGYIRIAILVYALYNYCKNQCIISYSILYLYSSLLDMLDGYSARKLGQVTRFGACLDQLIDILTHTIHFAVLSIESNQLFRYIFGVGLVLEWVLATLSFIVSIIENSDWKNYSHQPFLWFGDEFLRLYVSNNMRNRWSFFGNVGHSGFPIMLMVLSTSPVSIAVMCILFVGTLLYWFITLLAAVSLARQLLDSITMIWLVDMLIALFSISGVPIIAFAALKSCNFLLVLQGLILRGSCICFILWFRRGTDLLRLFIMYPLIYQAMLYIEIDSLISTLYPFSTLWKNDQTVAAVESVLLRANYCVELHSMTPASIKLWLGEFFHIMYFGIWHQAFVAYLFWNPIDTPQWSIDGMVLTHFLSWSICYICYFVFPVSGPTYSNSQLSMDTTGFWFASATKFISSAKASTGTSFPSSHCALSFSYSFSSLLFHRSCSLAVYNWIVSLCLFVATVYLGMHYLIDSILGVIIAGVAAYASRLLCQKWYHKRKVAKKSV